MSDRKVDAFQGEGRQIHEAAALCFSRAAEAYEKGRPEYSEEAIGYIFDRFSLFGSALRVVDLAAGTGKFTKVLAGMRASVIASITAVEPVAEMRAKGESVLKSLDTGKTPICFIDGTAEKIPLPDSSFDVLAVAQAFHWFDGRYALSEIHRVLRPGGMLLMIWNVRDESFPWIRAMTDLMVPYEGTAPRYRSLKWRDAFESSVGRGQFTPLELTKFHHKTVGPMQTMIDRVASVSFVSALAESERSLLLEQMRKLFESQMRSCEIAMPYETHIFTCFRI